MILVECMTWVYLLHAKSYVISIFLNFHAFVGTQFDIVMKYVRIDNGKEFCEGVLKHFLLLKGIKH